VVDLQGQASPRNTHAYANLFEVSDFLRLEHGISRQRDFKAYGVITLGAKAGHRERKVRFNYTLNPHMKELKKSFAASRRRRYRCLTSRTPSAISPFDVPKQLEMLENDLRLARITEPARLLTALNEIAGEIVSPLIARNHAKRIDEAIKKGTSNRRGRNSP